MCIKARPRLALVGTELRTSHRSLLLQCNNLPTSQAKQARREKEGSGRISVTLLIRYLYHRPKTYQMIQSVPYGREMLP